ncbi:MAG: insulinase family protein [Bacteroidales bacterium]|nr:insulinase family protein [Bacteroidales bacterium]
MRRVLIFIAALFAAATIGNAQNALPNDPAVKVGKLDNGMTYYIRHNDKPAQRAEFYLATHVGAIQETPDQDGLAHFLEHMCFNGLKNLPGKQMLEYLQSIGAEFGRNINASTGVESTQYMLNNIPVTREGIIDTCLLVMHDYSHFVLNEQKEIDDERGVIIEERRTRRNASWRMSEQDKQYMYKGSKYADCTIIGSQENLETFKRESLVNFYETWYRPDNQALIVVGDIDPDQILSKIQTLFADIPAPVNPKAKDVIKIPDNKEPIVGIVTDPENPNSEVMILWKSEPLPWQYNNTDVALLTDLLKDIIGNVMSERFQEITSKPDAPFLNGMMGCTQICETCDVLFGDVAFKEGEVVPALTAFYTEVEKVKRHGFTDSEIQRAKDAIISHYEKSAEGADSRKNSEFVRPLINNFFNNKPYMVPATELQVVKSIMQMLPAAAVNQVAPQLITEDNMVIIYNGPKKEGLTDPTEAQLLEVIGSVRASEIAANAEEQIASEFVDPAKLKGGKVKKTASLVKGITEWTLSNGVKVAFLPTDYKKDQVLIRLVKDGGTSLIPTEDLPSFEDNVWSLFLNNGGVSKYSASTVSKMLAGKQLSVTPYLESMTHGISGNCQPKDLETALQLFYLYFTDPRFDPDEFNVGKQQIEAVLPNILKTPNFKFQQELQRTISGGNPRTVILDEDVLAKADVKVVERNYRKLFKNAAGVVVYIVGNVDEATLKPMVEKYFGSLPKGCKPLKWKDDGQRIPAGRVLNEFKVDMQTPKTTVFQFYSTYDVKYSVAEKVNLTAAEYILDMIFTETLREEEGGTYGAQTMTSSNKYPVDRAVIQVYFDTNPSSADKLRELATAGLNKLATEGPTAEQMTRVKENFKKNVPEKRIQNNYWMDVINHWYRFGNTDYDAEYESAVNALSAEGIRDAVAKILKSGNFGEVVMSPDKAAERE